MRREKERRQAYITRHPLFFFHFFINMLQYLKTKEEREAFIDKYDNFLFDCDGK